MRPVGLRPVRVVTAAALGLLARTAGAQETTPQATIPEDLPVAFGADELSVDARSKAVEVRGNVHVDVPPFHLQADALDLRRGPVGVDVEGHGKVAFCPCLGTPLAIRFRRATSFPPHDLVLRDPGLEVFGVPVAWLPVFWLRSPGKPGLLPPAVAWRGSDGFFAGGGLHLPLFPGDLERGLDLRAGGYAEGGAAVEGTLRTWGSTTTVGVDDLRADVGLRLTSRGATSAGSVADGEAATWSVDALRGARAVRATTDVDAASRPFDRATATVAWEPDGWLIASGIRAAALRGGPAHHHGARRGRGRCSRRGRTGRRGRAGRHHLRARRGRHPPRGAGRPRPRHRRRPSHRSPGRRWVPRRR